MRISHVNNYQLRNNLIICIYIYFLFFCFFLAARVRRAKVPSHVPSVALPVPRAGWSFNVCSRSEEIWLAEEHHLLSGELHVHKHLRVKTFTLNITLLKKGKRETCERVPHLHTGWRNECSDVALQHLGRPCRNIWNQRTPFQCQVSTRYYWNVFRMNALVLFFFEILLELCFSVICWLSWLNKRTGSRDVNVVRLCVCDRVWETAESAVPTLWFLHVISAPWKFCLST